MCKEGVVVKGKWHYSSVGLKTIITMLNQNDDQVKILNIAIGQNREAWDKFITKKQYQSKQHYIDHKQELENKYRIDSLPFYCLIDAEGKVIGTYNQIDVEYISSVIEKELLLKASQTHSQAM